MNKEMKSHMNEEEQRKHIFKGALLHRKGSTTQWYDYVEGKTITMSIT